MADGPRGPVGRSRARCSSATQFGRGDREVRLSLSRTLAALGDPDPTIRGHAALAVGARGVTRAVPTLLGMVVEGRRNDVEAAEILGTLETRDAPPGGSHRHG